MEEISKFFSGQKTNLGMIILGVLGILMQQGVITEELGQTLLIAFGSLTGVALRQGMKKIGQLPKNST